MLVDCLVKPRELSRTISYLVSPPTPCCTYQDPSSGPFDSLILVPLHSSCSSLLSLLLRTFFPLYCRATFTAASPARIIAIKARQSSIPILVERRLSCNGVK